MVQLSFLYMTTGKTIALTRWTFVDKLMSLLFNMLSRLVKAFLSRGKHLLISWLYEIIRCIILKFVYSTRYLSKIFTMPLDQQKYLVVPVND